MVKIFKVNGAEVSADVKVVMSVYHAKECSSYKSYIFDDFNVKIADIYEAIGKGLKASGKDIMVYANLTVNGEVIDGYEWGLTNDYATNVYAIRYRNKSVPLCFTELLDFKRLSGCNVNKVICNIGNRVNDVLESWSGDNELIVEHLTTTAITENSTIEEYYNVNVAGKGEDYNIVEDIEVIMGKEFVEGFKTADDDDAIYYMEKTQDGFIVKNYYTEEKQKYTPDTLISKVYCDLFEEVVYESKKRFENELRSWIDSYVWEEVYEELYSDTVDNFTFGENVYLDEDYYFRAFAEWVYGNLEDSGYCNMYINTVEDIYRFLNYEDIGVDLSNTLIDAVQDILDNVYAEGAYVYDCDKGEWVCIANLYNDYVREFVKEAYDNAVAGAKYSLEVMDDLEMASCSICVEGVKNFEKWYKCQYNDYSDDMYENVADLLIDVNEVVNEYDLDDGLVWVERSAVA